MTEEPVVDIEKSILHHQSQNSMSAFSEQQILDGTTTGGGDHSNSDGSGSGSENQLARRENIWVKWSRLAVMAALLLCGAVLAGIAYFIGTQSETAAFEEQVSIITTYPPVCVCVCVCVLIKS